MDINVTIKYGLRSALTLAFPAETTVGGVLADNRVRSGLGLPESFTQTIDGVTVGSTYALKDGDELVIEKSACEKGA